MGFFGSVGSFLGRCVEGVGDLIGSESVANAGRKIQSACAETADKVGNEREYEKESASVYQTVNVNEILYGFFEQLKVQADRLETESFLQVKVYYDELFKLLHSNIQDVRTERLEARFRNASQQAKGVIGNHIAKHVSLDNVECLAILQLAPGSTKRSKMDGFGKKVIRAGLRELTNRINVIVVEQNEEIKYQLGDMLEQRELDLNDRQQAIDRLVDSTNPSSIELTKCSAILVRETALQIELVLV